MAGPVQQLKLAFARRLYIRQLASKQSPPDPAPVDGPARQILNLARWAPSGDNAQPWRFQIVRDDQVIIQFRDDAPHNPYEYRNGEPALLSLGMLLETIQIAASSHGRALEWNLCGGGAEPVSISARFPLRCGIEPDPLAASVTTRSVDRGPFRRRPLTTREKSSLQGALGRGLTIRWLETTAERWRVACLGARVTNIRLRAPELFPVHQRIIDWENRHSPGSLPAGAVGLDRATLMIMRWAMQSWERMRQLNRVFGTRMASAQLDLWPGINSAAYFLISTTDKARLATVEGRIRAGASIQRFWLTATKLGLAVQPASALLMVAHDGARTESFTADPVLREKARAASRLFVQLFGSHPDDHVFIGRIGEPRRRLPGARSVRRPLSELITDDGALRTEAARP